MPKFGGVYQKANHHLPFFDHDGIMNLRILLRLVNKYLPKCLVLICGSAGDGKSHLVAYLKFTDPENLLEGYTLYNDATESDAPTQAALERMATKLEPLFHPGRLPPHRAGQKSPHGFCEFHQSGD